MQKRLRAKEINFLKATDHVKEEAVQEKNKKTIVVAVPLILLLIVAGISIVLVARTYGYNKKTDKLQKQLDAIEASANAGNAAEKEAKYSELVAAETELTNQLAVLKARVEVNKGTMSYIIGASGKDVTIHDISFEDNAITVSLVAKTNTAPPLYVQRLRRTGAFSKIGYSGFSKDERGYTFSVQLELNQIGGGK